MQLVAILWVIQDWSTKTFWLTKCIDHKLCFLAVFRLMYIILKTIHVLMLFSSQKQNVITWKCCVASKTSFDSCVCVQLALRWIKVYKGP